MTPPTPETLAAIEGMAVKATPGPWAVNDPERWITAPDPDHDDGGYIVLELGHGQDLDDPDLAFIAACDPQTVLGLVEALREAWNKVERVERLERSMSMEGDTFGSERIRAALARQP